MADKVISENLPSTRAEARASGSKWYFTAVACRHGHLGPRRTATTDCVRCVTMRTCAFSKRERKGPNGDALRAKKLAERNVWLQKPGVKDKITIQDRKWGAAYRKRNPIMPRVLLANGRSKRQGIEGKITVQEVEDLIEKQKGKCANCFKKLPSDFHLDHKNPLKLRGPNLIWNIEVLCGPCNRKKHSTNPFDWAWLQGRLL